MNLLNECNRSEIELIEKAGITIENKDYSKEELKKCQLQIEEYIISHSSKNGDIDKLSNQYSSIFKIIEAK
jgi:hypothetical protein